MDKPKFERVYTLEQQTPLIHFQYDQPGATLRATEVKPKLDKFIIKKMKEKGEKIPKEWVVNGESEALDYKLKFSCANIRCVKIGRHTDYDIYYGNMGDEHVKGVLCSGIEMTIICFQIKLHAAIKEAICDFFIANNFGRMKSKGFGSFLIVKIDDEKIGNPGLNDIANILMKEYGAKVCYYFDGGNTPFKRIKTVYSLMKSGINFGKNYRHSLLFMYMHSLGLDNEKAWMKQNKIAPNDVFKDGNEDRYKKYRNGLRKPQSPYYVRALLGTGDHYDFLTEVGNFSEKSKIKVKVSSKEIERYNSTVFYKVIDNIVYYVGKRINKDIFGKLFDFERYNYQKKTPSVTGKLSTPSKNENVNRDFMDGFLEYCYKYFNNPVDGGTKLENFYGMQDVKIKKYSKENNDI